MNDIRPATLAGSFYPDSEDELKKLIKTYLEEVNVPKVSGNIKGLVSPHAGITCSGPTAAFAYKLIKGKNYKNVIIIGPSHRVMFSGIALANFKFWKTPLGIVNVSKLNNNLVQEDNFNLVNEAHIYENSIEIQLPFLQYVLEEFEITPLATGRINDHKEIALTLKKHIEKDTLIIASTDLSHYLPYDSAKKIDKRTIKQIEEFDTSFDHEQACGADSVKIIIELARMLEWEIKFLDYRNSGDTIGDKSKVVGYASFAFYK